MDSSLLTHSGMVMVVFLLTTTIALLLVHCDSSGSFLMLHIKVRFCTDEDFGNEGIGVD